MSLFDDHGEGPEDEQRPSPDDPVTPYAGTSGWSGSDTSRERAEHDDTSGITGVRQRGTVALLRRRGARGATWREVAAEMGWHHGQASGALSVLHKTGYVARLTEVRERCKVYVHPDFVGGRPIEEPGSNRRADVLATLIADMVSDYIDQAGLPEMQMQTWQHIRELVSEYRDTER